MSWLSLRVEFRALRNALEELHAAIQHHAETINAAEEAQKHSKRSGQPMPVIVTYDKQTVVDTKVDQDRNHRTQESIKNWTKFAVIAATIYAAIAFVQWLKMREANQISRESLEAVQRAFVSFQHFTYLRIQQPDQSHVWDIEAVYENSGVTNAGNVVGIIEMKELPTEPTQDQFIGAYSNLIPIGIPPKGTRNIRVTPQVPEPLIFSVDLGPTISTESTKKSHFNHNLYTWGWVYYRDIFSPRTQPHIEEFCYHVVGINYLTGSLNVRADQHAIGDVSFAYESCHTHNCDDEQCKDYETVVEAAGKTK